MTKIEQALSAVIGELAVTEAWARQDINRRNVTHYAESLKFRKRAVAAAMQHAASVMTKPPEAYQKIADEQGIDAAYAAQDKDLEAAVARLTSKETKLWKKAIHGVVDLECLIDIIDATRFILQGEDDGNPADTIREQLCSVVGYSTDGKTDAMLDETLEALADMATDSALTAVMQAARDILKTDATA